MCSFNNELDILEIRLAELDPVVDVFVFAEATRTHTNKPKRLILQENLDRFEPWREKMRIVTVEFPPFPAEPRSNWKRENYQRDQLKQGLDGLAEDDLVMISDLDEIPNADFVRSVQAGGIQIPIAVSVPIYTYRLNWRWPSVENEFAHIRFFRGYSLLSIPGYADVGPQQLFKVPVPSLIGDYGWHFSYVGDAEHIQLKIDSLADAWIKKDPAWRELDHIENSIETGVDLFGRDYRDALLVEDEKLPRYVQENRERFAHILA